MNIDMTQTPIALPKGKVLPEWLDYNGHMNVAFYVKAFDDALEYVWEGLGLGENYIEEENKTGFTLEMHICYIRELRENDPLRITFQMLEADEKRMHFIMLMFHDEKGYLAASCEQIAIHVDLAKRRAAPYPPFLYENVIALRERHKQLPIPEQVGRLIAIPPKK